MHVLEPFVKSKTGKGEAFDELVEAYYYNEKLYLPLEQLFTIFEFPIVVKLNQGTAQGWFFRENYIFDLNLSTKTIKAKGQTYSFKDEQVIKGKDDIYIESALLGEATGIKFDHDPKIMQLIADPPEPFPATAFKKRSKKLGLSRSTAKKDTSEYKKIEGEYKNFTMPLFDISLDNTLNIKPKQKNTFGYTITETNHMLGFASKGFFTRNGNKINNINFNLNKTHAKGGLLGPLNANSYSMGDVYSIQVPLASNANAGVGIKISNYPIIQSANLDATSFTGYRQPGWQAELYRNDALMEFLEIGEDGFYEFKDIPLNFGINKFKIIFYGPQGQKEEETKTINTSDAVLTPGEKRYVLFAGEKNKKLFENVLDTQSKEKGRKISGLFEYGIVKDVSIRTGFNNMEFYKKANSNNQPENRNYFTLGGATTKLQPFLLIADYAYDTEDKGHAAKVSALTNLYNINIKADHAYLSNFYSELYNPSSGSEFSTISSLNLAGSIPTPKKIGAFLTLKKERFKDQTRYNDYINNRLSTTLGKLGNISNSLSYKKQVTATSNVSTITGAFLSNKQIGAKTSVRSNINYTLKTSSGSSQINSIGITIQHKFNIDLTGRLAVTKSGNTYSYSSGLSWNLEKVRLGFSASGSNNNTFSIGMSLNFALFQEPYTKSWHMQRDSIVGRAPISAYHFLDKDQDEIYDDEHDEILHEIGIDSRAKQIKKHEHVTILPHVSPHQEFHLESDEKKLEFEHATMHKGITITPKQGAFSQVAIPVIHAGEVEGEVYLKDDPEPEDNATKGEVCLIYDPELKSAATKGEVCLIDASKLKSEATKKETLKPIFKAKVELVDSEGKVVATKETEPDGYFLFEKVRLGKYTVRISEEYLKRYNSRSKETSLQISKKEINSLGNKLIVQRD